MEKNLFISDLKSKKNEYLNKKIYSVFLVSKIIVKQSNSRKAGSGNENFCQIKLQDKSGLIDGIIWPEVYKKTLELIDGKLKVEDCVAVEGSVSEYRDGLQIVVSSIKKIDPGEIDYSYFIRALPEENKKNLKSELEEIIGLVEDKYLKILLDLFFKDEEILSVFSKSAAAVKYHHAYAGGLIEHSVNVAKNCIRISDNYPGLNKDLLIAGALLHDVGKIEEYYTGITIKITDEGNLLGHISLGYGMVREKIKDISGFPEKTAKELLHIIISHHGYKEFGSPRVPETQEAFVVYHMDHLDADIFHDKFETDGETLAGIENSDNNGDDVPTHVLKKSRGASNPSDRIMQDELF